MTYFEFENYLPTENGALSTAGHGIEVGCVITTFVLAEGKIVFRLTTVFDARS